MYYEVFSSAERTKYTFILQISIILMDILLEEYGYISIVCNN
jgi:hypothetical protein